MNKVILYGNLTRDVELKALPSGFQIASFGLATNRKVKKDDKWEDHPEFHSIVVFGKQAESCKQYLNKGQTALIEGRIQTRSYEHAEKGKQYKTEVVAERVQFGPRTAPKVGEDIDQRPAEERAADEQLAATDDVTTTYPEPEDEGIDPSLIPF